MLLIFICYYKTHFKTLVWVLDEAHEDDKQR